MTFAEDHEYKRGEILVFPFGEYPEDSPSYLNGLFHGLLGHAKYNFKGRHDSLAYIVSVPEGDELSACEDFRALHRYIDWANLWDITAEERSGQLENVIGDVESLMDLTHESGPAYAEGLDRLIDRLREIRPKSS